MSMTDDAFVRYYLQKMLSKLEEGKLHHGDVSVTTESGVGVDKATYRVTINLSATYLTSLGNTKKYQDPDVYRGLEHSILKESSK